MKYTAVYQYTALIYRGISAVYLKTRLIYRGFLAVYRGILAVYRGILAVYLISRRYPVSPSVHIPSIYRHIPSYTVHIPSIYRRYTEPFRHRGLRQERITTAAQQLDLNNKQKSFVVDVKAMLLSSVAKSLTPFTTRSKLICVRLVMFVSDMRSDLYEH
jgi:hypothetical protein